MEITQIINYFVPDLITAAQAGNTYYVSTNSPETISELQKLDSMTMFPIDILFYRYFICNMEGVDGNENPVMQNPKVREAILYAIDRETLATQLFPELANVINSGVPNSYEEYNGVSYDYDPEKQSSCWKRPGTTSAIHSASFIITRTRLLSISWKPSPITCARSA